MNTGHDGSLSTAHASSARHLLRRLETMALMSNVDLPAVHVRAQVDDEVHAFVNEIDRSVGTYLLGRRMIEVLSAWETIVDERPAIADYARIWRSTDKVVYSSTLESVSTARTRLERTFDPKAVATLKASADRPLDPTPDAGRARNRR